MDDSCKSTMVPLLRTDMDLIIKNTLHSFKKVPSSYRLDLPMLHGAVYLYLEAELMYWILYIPGIHFDSGSKDKNEGFTHLEA